MEKESLRRNRVEDSYGLSYSYGGRTSRGPDPDRTLLADRRRRSVSTRSRKDPGGVPFGGLGGEVLRYEDRGLGSGWVPHVFSLGVTP